MRVVNSDGRYLKLDRSFSGEFREFLIPPEDIHWVDHPEDATIFKDIEELFETVDLVRDATGAECWPDVHRPEEGYFVITNPYLGVLLRDGGWQYADQDCKQRPLEERVNDEMRFAVWWKRQTANDKFLELVADEGFRAKLSAEWGPAAGGVLEQFRVEHVAEVYGCDPALWEKETQTPDPS
ncbi:MAG: hypothetical protein C0501_25235 [Isosphaera sp.]|nr:hypothetical protein [Isosphaera sp.]